MNNTGWIDQLPTAPKILITRLSAIGDCIHTVPLLGALRTRWPQAWLGWATQAGPATLLENHPWLDELIVVPRGWMTSPSKLGNVRRQVQRTSWDVVLDPQSLTKSAVIGWLSGCPHRIGFTHPQGREFSRLLNRYHVPATRDHVVDRYLELLQPFGIEPTVRWRLGPYPAAAETVMQLLRQCHLSSFHYAIINTGAGWPSKQWPGKRYGAVAKYLGQRYQMPSLVVWSGSDELLAAEEIVEAGGGHALLAPQTSLPELAELARRARLFVGSDTGPLHLAAAVDTPCVALFGPTEPRVCGPYGHGHHCVQTYLQAQQGRRRATNLAMRAIRSTQVCQVCDEVLASQDQRAA